jgi:hypothetical protein
MDFTFTTYTRLLNSLRSRGYSCQTVEGFIRAPRKKTVILRHDVDRLPENALRMARLENEKGIRATYYFRAMPKSWDGQVIMEIAMLGHEIGYHYENLSYHKGNLDKALSDFQTNLSRLRQLAPVFTICKHGSPFARINNLDLWKTYDYRKFGIIAEPYLDIDRNQVFYLSDIGRRWDGWKMSVQDSLPQQEGWFRLGPVFRSTREIIRAAEEDDLPDKVMINFHPQRWHDRPWPWVKELVGQNVKNVVKAVLIRVRK